MCESDKDLLAAVLQPFTHRGGGKTEEKKKRGGGGGKKKKKKRKREKSTRHLCRAKLNAVTRGM